MNVSVYGTIEDNIVVIETTQGYMCELQVELVKYSKLGFRLVSHVVGADPIRTDPPETMMYHTVILQR